MKRFLTLVFLCIVLSMASMTWAVKDSWADNNTKGVEALFAKLKCAYEKESVFQIVECFEYYVPTTDIFRNMDIIYTQPMICEEMRMGFGMVSNIKVEFTNPQIQVEQYTAMYRAIRILSCNEFPTAYAEMVYTLQKNGQGWGGQHWKIVNQVLVNEWYDIIVDSQDLKVQSAPPAGNNPKKPIQSIFF